MAKSKITATLLITLAVFVMLLVPITASAQSDDPLTSPPDEQNTQQEAEQEPTDETTELPREADIQNSLCAGANLEVGTDCETENEEGQSPDQVLNDLVADIINLFSWVVGIVAVIMIIVGGFRYITSGGDSTSVGNAKNTIMYAIIGLIIVALSQWIVRFVLGRVVNT